MRNSSNSWRNRKKTPARGLVRIILALLILGGLIWAGHGTWRLVQRAAPAVLPPPANIVTVLEQTQVEAPTGESQGMAPLKLTLPPGFTMRVFAQELPGARVLTRDANGVLLVSLTAAGKIVALPDRDGNGAADEAVTVLAGLSHPHGLAFRAGGRQLYVAETEAVTVFEYDAQHLAANQERKLAGLPPGGRHFIRSLLLMPGPPERLLVSVGSSGDGGEEKDGRYAKVLGMSPEGGNPATFASGLRTPAFMALEPGRGRLFATEVGRDRPEGDQPPDEINILTEGKDYGWPWCYGKQVHDAAFDPGGARRDFCRTTEPSYMDLPAHSAPLGLAFVPAEGWPPEYQGSLLVAYHGSGNRSAPTGYKIVRCKPDGQGGYGPPEDFITGWLTPENRVLGRPVDLLALPGGGLYISDDQAGVVYRVSRTAEPPTNVGK